MKNIKKYNLYANNYCGYCQYLPHFGRGEVYYPEEFRLEFMLTNYYQCRYVMTTKCPIINYS